MNAKPTTAATAILCAFVAPAAAATLNFDTMNGGVASPSEVAALAGDEFSDFGVRITAAPNRAGSTLGLFNADCGPDHHGAPCSGGDTDLGTGPTYGTDPQGRVLIINRGGATLNDDARGGSITFSFDAPDGVRFETVRLLDIDEVDPADTTDVLFEFEFVGGGGAGPFSAADLVGFDAGNSANLSSSGWLGNNSFYGYRFRGAPGADAQGFVPGVSAFTVTYDDISGAIGAIAFEPTTAVPLPAGLPLLLGGVAALGLARSRRR